jgi:hypothetical protein
MRTSIDIITQLINHDLAIEAITLLQFPTTPLLQERLPINGNAERSVAHALNLRSMYNIPFWDGLMNAQFQDSAFTPALLKEALHHNKVLSQVTVKRADLYRLKEFSGLVSENYGINSRVYYKNGQTRHIVLLDFHLPKQPENIVCAESVLKLLGLKGYLLETNKSYHFIGDSTISEHDLKIVLYRALLFSPIIDKNWIAHQLLEGSCTLRITAKDGSLPQVISEI